MSTANILLPPNGWLATTNIKVDPWHYNSHAIDELCITWCNPSDRHDPNLVQCPTVDERVPYRADARNARSRAQAPREAARGDNLQWSFNFEASEQLNAWIEPFSATMTKMRPEKHDLFLCIILQIRADDLHKSYMPLN
jgi:hypothetical protein